jgi:hypothetical protein
MRQKNMVMNPAGARTKNNCTSENHQQPAQRKEEKKKKHEVRTSEDIVG